MTEIQQADVVILGGGPAGLTAAIYAARNNRRTLVVERAVYGGQLSGTEHVENFPGFSQPIGGYELSENMRAQAERFGTQFIQAEAKSLTLQDGTRTKVLHTSEGDISAPAFILASGSSPRLLDVPGEKKFWGRGISTCATCDGAFFRGKEVAVIGGGDSAVEEGSFLTNFASKVHIIHRRDKLRATPLLQKRAFDNPKISFIWDTTVDEYLGDAKVSGLRLRNLKTGAASELAVPGVFIFIGHIPNTKLVEGILDLDDEGNVKAQPNTRTNVPGIYAAGDLRVGAYRQAVTAAADGCMAAINAEHYLAALADGVEAPAAAH